MNPALIRSLIVIALRQAAPLLGGALMTEGEIERIAGAVILLGSIAYHVHKRTKGKKKEKAEDARKR